MSNEIVISDTSDDNLKPVSSKEDFINYVASYHGDKNREMQKFIKKDDWTIMQRLFTQKDLIRIAKDQRITQIKSSFELINESEKILNGLILASLKNRAMALELKDMFHHEIDAIKDIRNDLANLDIEMVDSADKFSKFYLSSKKKFEEYEHDEELHKENVDMLTDMRKKYYQSGKEQLERIHKKLSEIENKYK